MQDVIHQSVGHRLTKIAKSSAIVKELKDLADEASDVYLATDDDREGEAIAYHLMESLELKSEPKRINFNEK